jgi:hypothetical protein
MPFQKGQSGNPAGRPPGSRNRATLFAEALLEGEAEMIVRNAIRAAVNDVPWAVRLCFDRLSPRLRSRAAPIAFELPQISTAADIAPAIAKISSALAEGDITIDEAERYTAVLERWSRMLQSAERSEKPAGKVEFGWIDPRTGAPGTGGIDFIIDFGDGAGPRVAGPRAIDNPSLAVNEDAEPARATANPPSPSIDNPIVVGNAPADAGQATADPAGTSIDNSIVVGNAGARSPAVDSHVHLQHGDEALRRDIDIAKLEHAPASLLTGPPPTSEPDAPQGDGAPPSPLDGNDRLAKSTRSPDGA